MGATRTGVDGECVGGMWRGGWEDGTAEASGSSGKGCCARHSSFDASYADTYGPLGGYALSLVGDRTVAEDLTQEAMLRVYTRWATLRQPRPYAYRIVTNLARDRWRRRQSELASLANLVPQAVTGPDVSVMDAVSRLPSQLRASSCCTTTQIFRSRTSAEPSGDRPARSSDNCLRLALCCRWD